MTSITLSNRNKEIRWLDGHCYLRNKLNSSGSVSWQCRNKCGGWALEKDEDFKATKPHIGLCEPSAIAKEVADIKNPIKQRAQASFGEKPCHILSEAKQGVSIAASSQLPKPEFLRSTIVKRRRKQYLGNSKPFSREELEIPEFFTKTERNEKFLLYDSADKDRILIFTTQKNLQILAECNVWLCDGTFKSAPDALYEQVYSIHGLLEAGPCVLPLVFAFLPNTKLTSYSKMIEAIIQKSESPLKPKMIIVDYEQQAINAFASKFGDDQELEIQGCLFHLSQNIKRHVPSDIKKRIKDGDTELELLIKQISAHAFLPPDQVEKVFNKDFKPHALAKYPGLKSLLAYFSTNYVGTKHTNGKFKVDLWNVHDRVRNCNPRTTNSVEGWHNALNNLVNCAHPNYMLLIKKLKSIQNTTEEIMERLNAGEILTKKRPRQVTLDANLMKCVDLFNQDRPLQFLRGIPQPFLDIQTSCQFAHTNGLLQRKGRNAGKSLYPKYLGLMTHAREHKSDGNKNSFVESP